MTADRASTGTDMLRRWIAVVLIGAAVVATPAARSRQALALNTMEMLDLYERHRDLAVAGFGDHIHLDSVWNELMRDGKTWIDADGKDHADRRRLVLVTFIVDVLDRLAPEDGRENATMRPRLIDWACDQLAAHHPLPAERDWRLAIIATLEHRRSFLLVAQQLERASQRFPDEPRFLLVRAWLATERPSAPSSASPGPPNPNPCLDALTDDHIWHTCDAPFFHDSKERFERAMQVPSIAAEARVQLAELHIKREHPDVAIELLRGADGMTDDPQIKYLCALLEGWAYMQKNDPARATTAFRRALAAIPNGQSAAVGLAANLLLDGNRDEPANLITRVLTNSVTDPWRTHWWPEYRRWPELMARLRGELQ